MPDTAELKGIAKALRREVIEMAYRARTGHIGSVLSMTDVLAALYFEILAIDPKNANWPGRDRFILSKGHGAAALYAALAKKGFFSREQLSKYLVDGENFGIHPSTRIPGVEMATGSLGHGLSAASGMALAAKHNLEKHRVFALLSDGECDAGSTWEAAMLAGQHQLDNLTVIIDYNKIQAFGRTKEILDLEPLAAKWEAFGFSAREIDGHDFDQIISTFKSAPFAPKKPSVIIAHTVLGKGVSFMEDKLEWHYNVLTDQQHHLAIKELSF